MSVNDPNAPQAAPVQPVTYDDQFPVITGNYPQPITLGTASILNLNEWRNRCHDNSKAHGWWDGTNHNIPEKLALIHSEVSEALEAYRVSLDLGDLASYPLDGNKPIGFASELADILIRVFDLAGYLGIDLTYAVQMKHNYNITRPYRHGNKHA